MTAKKRGKWYGAFIILQNPTPTKHEKKEAKRFLCESVRRTRSYHRKSVSKLQFVLKENYEMWDPETGKVMMCATYGWKGYLQ